MFRVCQTLAVLGHAELVLRACADIDPEGAGECAVPPTRVSTSLRCRSRTSFTLEIPAIVGGGAPETRAYSRLDDAPATDGEPDAFSGYFLGSFGAHGPEVLHLQRGIWDGEEAVIAHKVTGEPL